MAALIGKRAPIITMMMRRQALRYPQNFNPDFVEASILYCLRCSDTTADDLRAIGALLRRQTHTLTYRDTPHDVGQQHA